MKKSVKLQRALDDINTCPFCGFNGKKSRTLFFGEPVMEQNNFIQEASCYNCKKTFHYVYTLVDIIEDGTIE